MEVSVFKQCGCSLTYRMQLQWEGLRYRQNLWQVWNLSVVELFGYVPANKLGGVLVYDILEVLASLKHIGRKLGIRAHPPVTC